MLNSVHARAPAFVNAANPPRVSFSLFPFLAPFVFLFFFCFFLFFFFLFRLFSKAHAAQDYRAKSAIFVQERVRRLKSTNKRNVENSSIAKRALLKAPLEERRSFPKRLPLSLSAMAWREKGEKERKKKKNG
jgi:hypothetical protein